jgi:hypothetical protein
VGLPEAFVHPDFVPVNAFVSRYRRHVTLTEVLPVAIGARPLTMAIGGLAVGRGQVSQAVQDTNAVARQAQEIATRARQAMVSG